MKYFILISMMFFSSFSFAARTPSAKDRYCGVLAIYQPRPPASCHTCTPIPAQYYIKVKNRTLDESDIGHGFVLDQPSKLIVRLAITRNTSAADGGDKGVELQRSLLRTLVKGKKYCAVGKVSTSHLADRITDQAVDFSDVYAGEK